MAKRPGVPARRTRRSSLVRLGIGELIVKRLDNRSADLVSNPLAFHDTLLDGGDGPVPRGEIVRGIHQNYFVRYSVEQATGQGGYSVERDRSDDHFDVLDNVGNWYGLRTGFSSRIVKRTGIEVVGDTDKMARGHPFPCQIGADEAATDDANFHMKHFVLRTLINF